MLKDEGLIEGSLYAPIEQAVTNGPVFYRHPAGSVFAVVQI